jgi:hypothetical protein
MRIKIVTTMFFYAVLLVIFVAQDWIIQSLGWKTFFVILLLWVSFLVWIRSRGKIF